MKKRIITIAGSLGSGKSSTGRAVAQALGFKHFSSGDLFRKIAAERGMTIEDINANAETHADVDAQVDSLLTEMGKNESNLVIDSRMSFHWIPDAFKVFLYLDPQTAAERIFNQIHNEGTRANQAGSSVGEILKNTLERDTFEKKKYMRMYNLDSTATDNFDIVINTIQNDLKTVTAIVLAAYKAWSETD